MVLDALEQAAHSLALAGRHLLVAVSGGVDSTVLAHGLRALDESLGLELAIGHVNHGLRGAASDADEDAVRALAKSLELPFAVRAVRPEALREAGPSRTRPSLQEAARRARYDALAEMADHFGAEHVATGHTLDDQAETVLLRLLRGSGPDGLGGIPERTPDGSVVRPLLQVSRSAIEQWARDQGLTWREDASNRDPRFARARLRHGGFSDLAEQMNPQWLRAIGDLAEAQRRDSEWIAELVDEHARNVFAQQGAALVTQATPWASLPPALAMRLVRWAWLELGGARDCERVHLERMVRFLRDGKPGTRIELPGGLELRAEGTAFRLWRPPVPAETKC